MNASQLTICIVMALLLTTFVCLGFLEDWIEEKEKKAAKEREEREKEERKAAEEKEKQAKEAEIIRIFNEDKRTDAEKLASAKAFLISDMGEVNIADSCIVGHQYVFTINIYRAFCRRIVIEKTKYGYQKVTSYSV